MSISIKMLKSDEYQELNKELIKELQTLYIQLNKVDKLLNKHEKLLSKGYEQYRTYSHNKRKDKITHISLNPIEPWTFKSLIKQVKLFLEINKYE